MPRPPKNCPSRIIDVLKHEGATRKDIPTAEMESFFRREENDAPLPPKRYPHARPLAEGETRTAEEPGKPELIWNGAEPLNLGLEVMSLRDESDKARTSRSWSTIY